MLRSEMCMLEKMIDSSDLGRAGVIFTVIRLLEQERQRVDSEEAKQVYTRIVNDLTLLLLPPAGEC
jgi:hypothetical protein